MCSIPKPPPAPQPPPAPLLKDPTNMPVAHVNSNIYQPVINNPSDCIWADDAELRRACIVARICLDKPPYRYVNKINKSVIQIGPTCGLAALSMLIDEAVDTDTILGFARNEGYTNHGEMLSCKDMLKLVAKVLSTKGIENIRYSVKKGDLNSPDTVECLFNGGALLVPYDADVNHSPALRNGHTAHWCLVNGIILIEKLDSTQIDTDNAYVLCRHGKSKFLSAWKLADLAKSNRNLWEFSPKKQSDDLEYVQPDGGLGGENGLRGQYLIFNWL